MSTRTQTATAYFDAFMANDHAAILSLLTDDVVWHIHGHRRLQGKGAFDDEIVGEGFEARPRLTIERVIDAGDTVIVPHTGETTRADGTTFTFAACDIFTFDGELISRVDSYVVPTT